MKNAFVYQAQSEIMPEGDVQHASFPPHLKKKKKGSMLGGRQDISCT